MSTKTLLSALLVSSFSMSLISAATEQPQENVATTPQSKAQTVMKFTAHSKAAQQRILAINDQKCTEFPFTRTAENNADQIVIKNSTLTTIDPWFFQGNKALKRVSFEGSTIDLTPFEGHTFLEACDEIEVVSFKGTSGVELATFLELYASPTLLKRILNRQCKLIIDMTDTGTTMANFAKDGVVTQDAIHFAIRTARILEVIEKERASASAEKPKGWLSTFTFGYLGE